MALRWVSPAGVMGIPDDADAGEATMMSLTAPLALRVLEAGRIPPGGTVLIQSAAGTIGHLAVQLARSYDPKTIIGTASTSPTPIGPPRCAASARMASTPFS